MFLKKFFKNVLPDKKTLDKSSAVVVDKEYKSFSKQKNCKILKQYVSKSSSDCGAPATLYTYTSSSASSLILGIKSENWNQCNNHFIDNVNDGSSSVDVLLSPRSIELTPSTSCESVCQLDVILSPREIILTPSTSCESVDNSTSIGFLNNSEKHLTSLISSANESATTSKQKVESAAKKLERTNSSTPKVSNISTTEEEVNSNQLVILYQNPKHIYSFSSQRQIKQIDGVISETN